jgi:hypothetical protein
MTPPSAFMTHRTNDLAWRERPRRHAGPGMARARCLQHSAEGAPHLFCSVTLSVASPTLERQSVLVSVAPSLMPERGLR